MENNVNDLVRKNFEDRRRALKLLLEAAKLLEQAEREDKHYGN